MQTVYIFTQENPLQEMMFKNIYIYGLGMMGGSIAKAIRINNPKIRIFANDINLKSLKYAKRVNIIDDFDSGGYSYLSKSNFIIICVPMLSYKSVIDTIKLHRKSDSLITDIGSTKKAISTIVKKNKSINKNFVGSHPLTGKEKASIKYSSADIFDNSYVLISRTSQSSKKSEREIAKFWRTLNCKTISITPEAHDKILSMTSHLPHILSFILIDIISKNKMIDNLDSYTGGGFRDLARLAKSDITMWTDIFLTNKSNIISTISKFSDSLTSFKKLISKGDSKKIKHYLSNRRNKSDNN